MENKSWWEKDKPGDKIWWKHWDSPPLGEFVFSFDKKREFNMFRDYPYKLNAEEKKIFDEENPFWADFFKGRK